MRNFLLVLFLFISNFVITGQNLTEELIFNLKTLNIARLEKLVTSTPSDNFEKTLYNIFQIQLELLKTGKAKELNTIIDNSLSIKQKNIIKTLQLMTQADILKHSLVGQDSIIFKKYQTALNIPIKNKPIKCEILKRILILVSQNSHLLEKYPHYLNIYEINIYDDFEKINHQFLTLNYQLTKSNSSLISKYTLNLNNILNASELDILKARHYRLIGMNYDLFLKNYDSAYLYHQKSINIYDSYNLFYTKDESFSSYINQGIVLNQQNKFLESHTILKKAIKIKLRKDKEYNKVLAYNWITDNYKKRKMPDSALFFLEKKIALNDSLNYATNADNINYLYTKFETAEKEKQILIEQQKKKQNRNIAFALGSLLLFVGITFILIQKNTKRKQLLAQQETLLETQKLTTVLKEQELTAIDAMIEGQEKERQRIANDLHDDLGGLMATVKMHFNVLKEKPSPELYDKTNLLLDSAYNKIRTVAHAKNSGVMANQGLLKAVKEIARTVSASNKIRVDVIDHGLEERLENSLELTIFRIIQELITNIIKHAEATEAAIHITKHDDNLNIMVEDNGKGFNTNKISKTSGIGINSIDKRIENLGGTVTIESEINKGTTVIIDIPS